ncbi:MAG: serine/threonine protein kinase, partial [Succinivibrio sp.]
GKDNMDDDTRLLGHAMMLAYLGNVNGTVPPDFFKGWISDRDLKSHNKISAEPVVLLTKSQLSDLKDITQRVLDSANKGLLDADQMFSQLRSIAASMGRDPQSLKQADSLKLGQMGLFGEYLDDLPYKSRLQELDEETWMSMGPDEQNRAIEDLEQKLTYYQKCNDDASKWIKLADDAQASESVYPVSLEALP